MKQFKKPMLIAAATIGAVGISTIGGSIAVNAQSTRQDNLVDKIAQKFNLNASEVQAVFDENRAEHEAEHQKKLEERLSQAVSDGKITSEQKDLIITKLAELKDFKDSLKDKSDSERKDAMKQKRQELDSWAKENNIPERFVHMPGGMRGPGGPSSHNFRHDDSHNKSSDSQ